MFVYANNHLPDLRADHLTCLEDGCKPFLSPTSEQNLKKNQAPLEKNNCQYLSEILSWGEPLFVEGGGGVMVTFQ